MPYQKILMIEAVLKTLEKLTFLNNLTIEVETFEGTISTTAKTELNEIKQSFEEIKKEMLSTEKDKIDAKLTLIGLKINSLLEKINKHI